LAGPQWGRSVAAAATAFFNFFAQIGGLGAFGFVATEGAVVAGAEALAGAAAAEVGFFAVHGLVAFGEFGQARELGGQPGVVAQALLHALEQCPGWVGLALGEQLGELLAVGGKAGFGQAGGHGFVGGQGGEGGGVCGGQLQRRGVKADGLAVEGGGVQAGGEQGARCAAGLAGGAGADVQAQGHPGLGGPGQVGQLDAAVCRAVYHAQGFDDDAVGGHEGEAQAAQAKGLQQLQFFVKAVVQVGGGLAKVLLAPACAGHGVHEVFVEVPAQANGGGGDALAGGAGDVGHDVVGVGQAVVGAAVREQHDARDGVGRAVGQGLGTGLPAQEQVGAAAFLHCGQRGFEFGQVHRAEGLQGGDAGVVGQHGELVLRGEVASDVFHAAQGFGQRLARHAAGAVHHEGEALGGLGAGGGGLGGVVGLDANDEVEHAALGGHGGLQGRKLDGGGGHERQLLVGHTGRDCPG
jgi:hypothetical protein